MVNKIIDEYTYREDLTIAQKYYYRNRDKINLKKKEDRLANPEKFKEDSKRWTSNRDKSKRAESIKKYKDKNPIKYLLYAAKKRSKDYNVPFNLLLEDVVIPEFCPILGLPLQFNKGKVGDNSPSIDRIIPNLGYVKDNIRVISYKANRYKSNLSINQLIRILAYCRGEI